MADPRTIENALRQVRDPQSFIQDLLIDALGWPVDESAVEIGEIGYDWTARELRAEGIEKKVIDGTIRQIGPFHGNPWGVFLLEFERPDAFITGRGVTGVLRKVLRGLVEKRRAVRDPKLAAFRRESLLFICTHRYTHYRFAYFKAPQDGARTAPLAAFGWGPDDAVRTVCEFNLGALEWPATPPQDAQAWISAWGAAFDVEKVTKRFYEDYRAIFQRTEARIQEETPLRDNELRLFTQSLFNRIMFLRFIERKGWLEFPGQTGRNYLAALMAAGGIGRKSFYQSRLRPLFFEGMAVEGNQSSEAYGRVPFLNGGLFEESALDKKVPGLPDEIFAPIIGANGLFYRYNFTVEESTPLDIEVAVDPEMLGKVFEELVTGRHESGSYYTPRSVVSFMCREALKGYLRTKTDASEAAIGKLVDEHDPSALSEGQADQIKTALDAVKAVDPACGSGAYLLGLMHELIAIRRALQSERLAADPRFPYNLKLHIISRNLYGVDIDPFAANIAMLRLWLSLSVDANTPVPLPNLDFKIECGDSLLGPNPEALPGLFASILHHQAAGLVKMKDKYLRTRGKQKGPLRDSIGKTERMLARELQAAQGEGVIDWRIHFAEVFGETQGFDIVLANPPYVRADAQFKHINDEKERQEAIRNWKEFRERLRDSGYYETVYEKWDLYIPFLERAFQLLAENGHMVFIIPDAYNAAKYALRSRDFFVERSRIERIDFCSEIPLFDAGVFNTIVHFSKSEWDADYVPVRVRRWGEAKNDFERNAQYLAKTAQSSVGPDVFRPGCDTRRPTEVPATLLGMICYISYGLRANADDRFWKGEFVTADLVSDRKDKSHPKPFLEGKDLHRWVAKSTRYLEWGTARAPTKFARPTFPQLHEAHPKLIALVVCVGGPPVIYDELGLFTTHTSCVFVPWSLLRNVVNASISKTAKYKRQDPLGDREEREKISQQFQLKYLLAIMNSSFARDWLAARRRSKIHVYPDDWKQLPIIPLPEEKQQEFVSLVDAILNEYEQHGYPLPAASAAKVAEIEQAIDERVAVLYGL